MDFQSEKQVVRDYYAALDSAPLVDIEAVMERFVADDYIWRGYHPFHEQTDRSDVGRRERGKIAAQSH